MGHSHALPSPSVPQDRRLLRFRLGAVLVLAAAACGAQFVGAALTGSVALLAESVHMLVDLLGLAVAFGVSLLPQSRPQSQRLKLEALSALLQSTLLIGVGIYALLRGLRGVIVPHPIAGEFLLIFASVGLVANLVAVAILYSSRSANLNLRAAFLEVISDALGSLVVIAAGLAVLLFGLQRADGIAALALAGLMIPRGVRILRSALAVVLPEKLRKSWVLVPPLVLSLIFGLGVSQLHQLYSPESFHLDPAPVDGYSWSGELSGQDVRLSFDREGQTALLEADCSSAEAPYQRALGGAVFGELSVEATSTDCSKSLPAELLGLDGAYYSESFEELQLYTIVGEPILELSSSERIRDQQRTDRWRPLAEFLFRL